MHNNDMLPYLQSKHYFSANNTIDVPLTEQSKISCEPIYAFQYNGMNFLVLVPVLSSAAQDAPMQILIYAYDEIHVNNDETSLALVSIPEDKFAVVRDHFYQLVAEANEA